MPGSIFVARFSLVANRQNGHDIAVVMVHGDITTVAKVNHPFPEFGRYFFDGASNAWLKCKHLDLLPDGLDRTFGCIAIFACQKPIKALNVKQGRW